MDDILSAFKISIYLAFMTTVILLLLGLPLAWWLVRTKGVIQDIASALVALPLILPPSVLGFYLLLFLSPDGIGGIVSSWVGLKSFAFRFEGLLIGSLLYSLPFVVQPLQAGFSSIGNRHIDAAANLGAGVVDRFFTIGVGMSKKAIVLSAIMGFSHTLGEFGVVLMIGGNIPNETRVISIAIFDAVERLDFQQAHIMSAILLVFSFVMVFIVSHYYKIGGGSYR